MSRCHPMPYFNWLFWSMNISGYFAVELYNSLITNIKSKIEKMDYNTDMIINQQWHAYG